MVKDKDKTLKILFIVTICLLVVFFIVSIVQLVFISSYRNKQKSLEKSLDSLNTQINDYEERLKYVTSDEYLDDYARQNGYIKDGEEKIEP